MFFFHTLEIHTLHVRDFGGERLIQSVGNYRDFEISTACAENEARAVIFPIKRIFGKTLSFMILFFVGVILSFTLSLKTEIFAIKALGIIAAFTGISGIISECRKILIQRRNLINMTPDERLKFCAWQCALKQAPKKFNDNDITYINIDEETLKLKTEELSEKYNLIPAISNLVKQKYLTA